MFTRVRFVPPSLAAIVVGVTAAAAAADRAGRLEMADGGVIEGWLAPGRDADGGAIDTLPWRATGFTRPFELQLDAIRGIRFPPPAAKREEEGWRICLRDGDVLAAAMDALDESAATVSRGDHADRRQLRIDRNAIDRIVRSGANAAADYVGPAGLAGWSQKPPNSWTEEAGAIQTAAQGATVTKDVGGGDRAIYDFELGWRQTPSCRIAVAATDDGWSDPYRLEVFGGAEPRLLLVREETETAESEPLPEGSVDPQSVAARRLRIMLFVDQSKGRLAVVLPDGPPKPVADVTIPPQPGRPASGRVRIAGGGDVTLKRLRVTKWVGDRPEVERRDRTAVVLRDGERLVGDLGSMKVGDRELVVGGEKGDVRVPIENVREITFAQADAGPPSKPSVLAVGRDGEAIRGDLVRVDTRTIWLQRAGIDSPVAVPIDGLIALDSLRTAAEAGLPAGRVGRLRREGVDARGGVAAVAEGIGWQPVGAADASPFADGSAAVLEYVERPAGVGVGADHRVGGIGGGINQVDDGSFVIVILDDEGAAAADGRVHPGDRIVAIAPEKGSRIVETKGLDLETVQNLLRGRIGTHLRLRVTDSDGGDPREVHLVRRMILEASPEILQAAVESHARLAPGDPPATAVEGFPSIAFLRTGDAVPCAVEAIDKDGIRIRTPLAGPDSRGAVSVPAARVQAVELVPAAASLRIDRKRIERLLTLPRMQQGDPPTHLLRLADGDYIRGVVLGLDDRSVSLSVAGFTKELPRESVARVIWLHPEDAVEEPPEADAGLLVQGVWSDGRRVTVAVERFEDGMIRGRSPAIGPAAIDTGTVDRLLIGGAIASEADQLPYRQWKLKPAPAARALRPAQGG